jgi:hypothetical protein
LVPCYIPCDKTSAPGTSNLLAGGLSHKAMFKSEIRDSTINALLEKAQSKNYGRYLSKVVSGTRSRNHQKPKRGEITFALITFKISISFIITVVHGGRLVDGAHHDQWGHLLFVNLATSPSVSFEEDATPV